MHRFYFDKASLQDNQIIYSGEDVNHIKNVLRLHVDDEVVLCDGQGTDFVCKIHEYVGNTVVFEIISQSKSTSELPVEIVLYQGLPKKDKMELIIQKCVELGVSRIVPVTMKRCIVKLEDEKSEKKKNERWTEIAKSAGKQSGRGILPVISKALSLKAAIEEAGKNSSFLIVPYENARGMAALKEAVGHICNDGVASVSIFIGPEGGFDEEEVRLLIENGASTVSLGHRILRTETAGFTTAAVLMYELESYFEAGD